MGEGAWTGVTWVVVAHRRVAGCDRRRPAGIRTHESPSAPLGAKPLWTMHVRGDGRWESKYKESSTVYKLFPRFTCSVTSKTDINAI